MKQNPGRVIKKGILSALAETLNSVPLVLSRGISFSTPQFFRIISTHSLSSSLIRAQRACLLAVSHSSLLLVHASDEGWRGVKGASNR